MTGAGAARRAIRGGLALLTLLAGLGLAGCGGDPPPPPAPPPVTVHTVAGSAVGRVELSVAGLSSLQLKTGIVQDVGGHSVVPMTAVVYDPKGVPWTYLVVGPRQYVRQRIVIASATGDQATLASGPAPGSDVVTVGAPELLGAEYGVGEE